MKFKNFAFFSVKRVKILKIIGLRDLKWSKYYKSSWFVTFCEFLDLKYIYSIFYSSEYTILGAKYAQILLWESMYGDAKIQTVIYSERSWIWTFQRKYLHLCKEYPNLSLTWKNYIWPSPIALMQKRRFYGNFTEK